MRGWAVNLDINLEFGYQNKPLLSLSLNVLVMIVIRTQSQLLEWEDWLLSCVKSTSRLWLRRQASAFIIDFKLGGNGLEPEISVHVIHIYDII